MLAAVFLAAGVVPAMAEDFVQLVAARDVAATVVYSPQPLPLVTWYPVYVPVTTLYAPPPVQTVVYFSQPLLYSWTVPTRTVITYGAPVLAVTTGSAVW